ncbi:MAG: hypothetical protein ACYC3S_01805 [Chloroflexota bacterium]
MRDGRVAVCVAIAIVLLVAAAASSLSLELAARGPTHPERPIGEIVPGFSVGQTFVAETNNLDGVALQLATYNRRNDCRLIFRLYDMSAGLEAYISEVACADIQDNAVRRFVFPTIEQSKGRTYLLTLESPDAGPGRAVTMWTTGKDAYTPGFLTINLEPQSGDAIFDSYYVVGPRELIGAVVAQLAENKPGVLGSQAFYAVLAGSYLLVLLALLQIVRRVRD